MTDLQVGVLILAAMTAVATVIGYHVGWWARNKFGPRQGLWDYGKTRTTKRTFRTFRSSRPMTDAERHEMRSAFSHFDKGFAEIRKLFERNL